MIARRTVVTTAILAPAALASCQFGYDVAELAGHYRADESRIKEVLTLFPDQTYLHAWETENGPAFHDADWRLEANWIHLNRYVRPGHLDGAEAVFIPGPPTFFFFGGPTFFARDLDLKFVWVRAL